METKKANIDNLTNLWSLGGKAAGCFMTDEDYAISRVPQSGWPNKLWFHKGPDKMLLERILYQWDMHDITVPIWGPHLQEHEELLQTYGFAMKNELTGMSISLDQAPEQADKLFIQKVTNGETADGKVSNFLHASPWSPHGVDVYNGEVYVLESTTGAGSWWKFWEKSVIIPRVRKVDTHGKVSTIFEYQHEE